MSTPQEFPKMVYRADGAKIAHLIVADPAGLAMAVKDGWGDRADAREAAAKVPQPAAAPSAGAKTEVNKKLMEENLGLVNQIAALEQAGNMKDVAVADLTARVGDLEGFLKALAADESAPPSLIEAINSILGIDAQAAAPPKAKPGKKA